MTIRTEIVPAAIIEALQRYEPGVLPAAALNSASEQWADCWPLIKANMYECSKNLTSLSEEQDNLLFYGVLLATQQREYDAYPLLMTIFDNDDDFDSDLERIFGDVITTLLQSIFYILSKDDYEQLNKLICSPLSGRFIKATAIDAIAAKHESGKLARGRLVALVRHWLNAVVSSETEVTECFLSTVCILCIEHDLHEFKQELIDLAHRDKLDPQWISPMEIEDWKPTGFGSLASGSVKDEFNVVAEMSNWAGFNGDYMPDAEDDDWIGLEADDWEDYEPSVPYIAPPKIGRNEPCICGSGKKYKKCCL
jgi:hypothetical protein